MISLPCGTEEKLLTNLTNRVRIILIQYYCAKLPFLSAVPLIVFGWWGRGGGKGAGAHTERSPDSERRVIRVFAAVASGKAHNGWPGWQSKHFGV